MSNGFIRYEVKNGVEYASVYKAVRANGIKTNNVEWLGRVIDKQKGIYRSRDRGTFHFSLNDGAVPVFAENLILDFGDSFLFHEILNRFDFIALLKRVFGESAETLLALVFYKTLGGGANYYAQTWWEGSYARMLFPNAKLASQRISNDLKAYGNEWIQRAFFKEYLQFVSSQCKDSVLVDSTGLPNDIRFPLTAVNNHNGNISNETRLVLVLERSSGLPVYFRYAAGNIVDVSTLETTIAEVRAYGIDVNHAIVDAGYYSDKNIKTMQAAGIAFVLRMPPNRKLYKELMAAHADGLEDAKNLVKYRDRFLYMKRVDINLFGHTGYAFIALDIERKHDETKKYFDKAFNDLELIQQ
jgi:hypothetical protein